MPTIKLSKKQWEFIGKKAGWIKESQSVSTQKKECSECHGAGSVERKLKNLGTLEYNLHTIPCPTCKGKGYTTKEDHDEYLHRVGLAPCPWGHDVK